MGGWGSGRREYADTPTVEACRTLDADEFTDHIEHPDGTTGSLEWGDGSELAVQFVNDEGGEYVDAIAIAYTLAPDTDAEETYQYVIPLEYTEPNFGGVRPWFRCPRCSTRRRKLYFPPRGPRYLCRECHDLGYTSSRRSGDDVKQAELRYRRAFAKADAKNRRPHPNGEPYFPDRPKGMHHDTFEDLVEDVRAARREHERLFMRELREMAQKSSIVLPSTGV
jgi:hypothetical protein